MASSSGVRRRRVAFISLLTIATTLSFLANADQSQAGGVVVAVIEPRDGGAGLDYTVSIGGHKFESTKAVMGGLRATAGAKLMLLMRSDVQVGRVSEVASMATKNGYLGDAISLFVFDMKREGMISIPGFRYSAYTEDAALLAHLASPGGGQE